MITQILDDLEPTKLMALHTNITQMVCSRQLNQHLQSRILEHALVGGHIHRGTCANQQ